MSGEELLNKKESDANVYPQDLLSFRACTYPIVFNN